MKSFNTVDRPFDIEDVRQRTASLVVGRDLRYVPEVGSTNSVLLSLDKGEWDNGTAVVTDYQSQGKGRAQRTWLAPPCSSILMSVMFAKLREVAVTDYVMLGALAANDAIRDLTGLETSLKWSNDILCRGRKLAGILADVSGQGEGTRIALGMGVNVNFAPGEHGISDQNATSIQLELGRPVSREDLLVGLFGSLDLWYRCLAGNADDVYSAWAAQLDTIGKFVTVRDHQGAWLGIAEDARRDGALLVRDKRGVARVVLAADVSLRQDQEARVPTTERS